VRPRAFNPYEISCGTLIAALAILARRGGPPCCAGASALTRRASRSTRTRSPASRRARRSSSLVRSTPADVPRPRARTRSTSRGPRRDAPVLEARPGLGVDAIDQTYARRRRASGARLRDAELGGRYDFLEAACRDDPRFGDPRRGDVADGARGRGRLAAARDRRAGLARVRSRSRRVEQTFGSFYATRSARRPGAPRHRRLDPRAGRHPLRASLAGGTLPPPARLRAVRRHNASSRRRSTETVASGGRRRPLALSGGYSSATRSAPARDFGDLPITGFGQTIHGARAELHLAPDVVVSAALFVAIAAGSPSAARIPRARADNFLGERSPAQEVAALSLAPRRGRHLLLAFVSLPGAHDERLRPSRSLRAARRPLRRDRRRVDATPCARRRRGAPARLRLPILADPTGSLADRFGAEVAPYSCLRRRRGAPLPRRHRLRLDPPDLAPRAVDPRRHRGVLRDELPTSGAQGLGCALRGDDAPAGIAGTARIDAAPPSATTRRTMMARKPHRRPERAPCTTRCRSSARWLVGLRWVVFSLLAITLPSRALFRFSGPMARRAPGARAGVRLQPLRDAALRAGIYPSARSVAAGVAFDLVAIAAVLAASGGAANRSARSSSCTSRSPLRSFRRDQFALSGLAACLFASLFFLPSARAARTIRRTAPSPTTSTGCGCASCSRGIVAYVLSHARRALDAPARDRATSANASRKTLVSPRSAPSPPARARARDPARHHRVLAGELAELRASSGASDPRATAAAIRDQVTRCREVITKMQAAPRPPRPRTPRRASTPPSSAPRDLRARHPDVAVVIRAGADGARVPSRRPRSRPALRPLDNALHASPAARRSRSSPAPSTAPRSASKTGPGVAPHLAGRLGEPFLTTKEPAKGWPRTLSGADDGRAVGGRLEVAARAPHGTRVTLHLAEVVAS